MVFTHLEDGMKGLFGRTSNRGSTTSGMAYTSVEAKPELKKLFYQIFFKMVLWQNCFSSTKQTAP
jgi:hypothetical protein